MAQATQPDTPPDFDIRPDFAKFLGTWMYSQLLVTPPWPTQSFAGQTVIVTGANSGLGLEAARHFYRLGCARLVLGVRTVAKGEEAKEQIVASVRNRSDGATAVVVWPLDLTSTKSVLAFASRARTELPRLDVLVENAGINPTQWTLAEGHESSIQVNVLNTFLLALDLLPKLTDTALQFRGETKPHLVVVSSEMHRMTAFQNINAPNLYEKLNDESSWSPNERYQTTKLLEVLFVRELVARLRSQEGPEPPVIIVLVNPGLCNSEIFREPPPLPVRVIKWLFGRTTEVGSRTLVHGASAGVNSHGEFMSDGRNQEVERWIYDDVGRRAQKKVFEQTLPILELRQPGVVRAAGL